MRNGSLWSTAFFETEVIFHEFDFETSDLEFEVSKSSILNAHNFVRQGCFYLSLLSHNFDDRLSTHFHRFVTLCICWETPSENTGLRQLPIVSNAFKRKLDLDIIWGDREWFFFIVLGCFFVPHLIFWWSSEVVGPSRPLTFCVVILAAEKTS